MVWFSLLVLNEKKNVHAVFSKPIHIPHAYPNLLLGFLDTAAALY